ncbi:MAG TPA: hypothetical protein VGC88_01250 [Terriglobales bacterium]|jgi:hypothetical protein
MKATWLLTGILAVSVSAFAQSAPHDNQTQHNGATSPGQNSGSTPDRDVVRTLGSKEQNPAAEAAPTQGLAKGAKNVASVRGCLQKSGDSYYVVDADQGRRFEILPGSKDDLGKHVGEKVDITGDWAQASGSSSMSSDNNSDNSSQASASSGSSPSDTSANNGNQIRANKVSMVSETCDQSR